MEARSKIFLLNSLQNHVNLKIKVLMPRITLKETMDETALNSLINHAKPNPPSKMAKEEVHNHKTRSSNKEIKPAWTHFSLGKIKEAGTNKIGMKQSWTIYVLKEWSQTNRQRITSIKQLNIKE